MKSTEKLKWNKFDATWMLNLFGTAVGAGVLFLPINAGDGWILAISFNGNYRRANDLFCSPWLSLPLYFHQKILAAILLK